MYHIVICIPTYKRPEGLKGLLQSIQQADFDTSLINTLEIVVVDNDAEQSAAPVIEAFCKNDHRFAAIHYHCYARKGLANVRNELLRKAMMLKPDFIVFIDDDEYVTKPWLTELVSTVITNNSDAARGPVIAELSGYASPAISCFFERQSFQNNERITSWTTGNLIVRYEALQKHKVWFDERFNETGSEDGYFGMQMAKKGATIHWADKAVAYEIIPDNRANLKWLLKRKFRLSSTFVYILILEKQYFRLGRKILVSSLYILLGLPAIMLMAFPLRKKYWGVLKLWEGLGGVAGLMAIRYPEYK